MKTSGFKIKVRVKTLMESDGNTIFSHIFDEISTHYPTESIYNFEKSNFEL